MSSAQFGRKRDRVCIFLFTGSSSPADSDVDVQSSLFYSASGNESPQKFASGFGHRREKILLLNWLIALQILSNSPIPLFTNFSRSVKRNAILYNSRTISPCHRQKAEARELRTKDLLQTRSETLKTRLKTKSETKLDLILPTIFPFNEAPST